VFDASINKKRHEMKERILHAMIGENISIEIHKLTATL
jgi:hypothetical protein